MKNTLETRLGLFFALVLIASVLLIEMIGGIEFFKKGYRLRARFNTIQDLRKGDAVKMGGKQIGRVDDIRFADSQVEVVLKIVDPNARVMNDSVASVRFLGLMGQNYISLGFGSPNAIPATEGSLLTSVEQPDFSQLMNRIEGVATNVQSMSQRVELDKLNDLGAILFDFMKSNTNNLGSILTNIQAVSSQVAKGEGTVGKLIMQDTLYVSALSTVTNLNATAGDIRSLIDQAKTVVAQVDQGQGTLGKLLKDEGLYKETSEAMTNLKEIFQKINRGQGTVGKLVNDEALLKNAKMTLQKLDKAADSLEDQGPMSVIGLAVGTLF
jgi:phospholipid/cholesterol/gamma-HCH transport system substrate-binding protein